MGKSHNISVPYSPHWDMRLVSPTQGCREDEIRQLNWKHHFLVPAEPNSHFSFTFFLSFFFFLVSPRGLQDLSSLARDRTHAP